jgi:hypothetical protein
VEIAIPTLASVTWLIKWAILLALATVTVALLGAFVRVLGWVMVKIIPILAAVLIVAGVVWVAREQLAGAGAIEQQVWQQPQDAPQQPQDAPPEPDRPSPMSQDPSPVEAQP